MNTPHPREFRTLEIDDVFEADGNTYKKVSDASALLIRGGNPDIAEKIATHRFYPEDLVTHLCRRRTDSESMTGENGEV